MPNPYLTAIRFEKEAEEKAREIKRKKEEVKNLQTEVEELIKSITSANIEIPPEIEKKRGEVDKALEIKDYDTAIELLKGLREDLKTHLHDTVKAYEERIKKYLSILLDLDVDITSYQVELDEGRNTIEEDVRQGISILSALTEKVLGRVKEALKEKEEEVRHGLARMPKDIQKKADGILREVEEHLKGEEYEEAARGLMEVLRVAQKHFEDELDKMWRKGDEYVSIAEGIGFPLKGMDEIKAESKKLLEEGKFDEAYEKAKEYYEKTRERVGKFVERLISIAHKKVDEAKLVAGEVGEAEALLNQAKDDFIAGDYREALAKIKKATVVAEKAVSNTLMSQLNEVREEVQKARSMGLEVEGALEILKEAFDAISRKNYARANTLVQKAKDMVARKLNRVQQLKSEIEDLRKRVGEMEDAGIVIEGIEEEISSIEKLIEGKRFDEAEKSIDSLKTAIAEALRDIATQTAESVHSMLEVGKEVIGDLEEELVEYSDIEKMIQAEDYFNAILRLMEIEEELLKTLADKAKPVSEEILSEAEKNPATRGEVEALVKKAMDMLSSEELDAETVVEALKTLGEARGKIWEAELEKLEQEVKDLSEYLELLDNYGGDVTIASELISRAKRFLSSRDAVKAKETIESAKVEISRVEKEVVKEVFNSAKIVSIAAKKVGVNLSKTPIKKLLLKAKNAIEEGDLRKAIEHSVKALEIAREYKDKGEAVYKVLAEAARKISEAKEIGADVADAAKLIVGAKKALEGNNFETASKLAEKALEIVESVLRETKISQLRDAINELSDVLEAVGNTQFREDVRKFEELLTNGDVDEAVKQGEGLVSTMRETVEDIITDYIGKMETALYEQRQAGVDVSEVEKLLDTAKEEFISQKYRDALEHLSKIEGELEAAIENKVRLQERIDDVERALKEAKSLRIDVSEVEKKLEEAKEEASRNIQEAFRKLAEIEKTIKELMMAKVESSIKKVEMEIKKAKKKGIDTTIAENLLQKAREALEDMRPKMAMKFAIDAMSEIEMIEMQKDMALNAIKSLDTAISENRSLVTKDIFQTYQMARRKYQVGEYAKAFELAMKAMEEISKLKTYVEEIKKESRKIKEAIAYATKLGVDMSEVVKVFNEAKEKFKKGDLVGALTLLKKGSSLASAGISKATIKMINAGGKYVDLSRKYGVNVEKMEELFQKLKEAEEKKDVPLLRKILQEMKEIFDSGMTEKGEEIVKSLRERIEEIKRIGISTEAIENALKEVEDALAAKKYREFFSRVARIRSALAEIIPAYAYRRLSEVGDRIKEYESLGVNLSEYHEKIADSLSRLERGEYGEIIDEMNRMEREIEEKVKDYFNKRVAKARSVAEKYRSRELMDIVSKMEEAVRDGHYGALEDLNRAFEQALETEREKMADIHAVISEVEAHIALARTLGMDVIGWMNEVDKLKEMGATPEVGERATSILSEIRAAIESWTPAVKVRDVKVENADVKGGDLNLVLANEGKAEARDVEVVITGACTSAEPITLPSIPPGDEAHLKAHVVAQSEEGEAIITVKYSRIDGVEYTHEHRTRVSFKEAKPEPTVEVKKAEQKEKCALCRGPIMPGMDMVICKKCGATYHMPCAKRFKKCIKCKSQLIIPEEKKVAKKIVFKV